ncbi:MAM and LDL-receptor class A domain-containing protein 1-like isoform X2 [Ptychodera flava]
MCILHFSGVYGQLECDFEDDLCGWLQSLDDEFDWSRHQGFTKTPHTGPSGDHTIGDGGYYVYIENNNPQAQGDTADLISPPFHLDINSTVCFSFWYHMHGAHIGELAVHLAEREGSLGNPLWIRQGTQGYQWKMAQITIKRTIPQTRHLIFRGTHGGRIQGDIALDDLTFTEGACPPQDMVCDFEDTASHLCGGRQDSNEDFEWSISGGSFGSGVDHTYKTTAGYFLYVQAADTNTQKTTRFITSMANNMTSDPCLEFFFKVTGQNIGTLNVYMASGTGQETIIWSRTPQLNEDWMIAQVNLNTTTTTLANFQLVFEVVRGTGNAGFLGIDDIRLLEKKCSSLASCTFEDGLCTWENTYRWDVLDWVQKQGGTSTSKTGPSFDHTTGTSNGTYIYIEASNSLRNSTGALYSEILPRQNNDSCLEFWYHMFGGAIGELQIDHVTQTNLAVTRLWTVRGNQGNEWNYGRVGIKRNKDCQIVFIAIRGTGPSGDIALDDIQLTQGYCEGIPAFVEPTASPITDDQGSNVVGIVIGSLVGVAAIVAVIIAGVFLFIKYRNTNYNIFKHEDKTISVKNLPDLEVTATESK